MRLTQVEVARRLSKAVSTIKGWESSNGTEPATLDDVLRVCELYQISIDHYVRGDGPLDGLLAGQSRLLRAYDALPPATQTRMIQLIEQINLDFK